MKTVSATKQPSYFLEPLENGKVRITLWANETEVEAEDGIQYEYDKYVVETENRPGFETVIESDIESWVIAEAKKETIKEQKLKELRETLGNQMEKYTSIKEMESAKEKIDVELIVADLISENINLQLIVADLMTMIMGG